MSTSEPVVGETVIRGKTKRVRLLLIGLLLATPLSAQADADHPLEPPDLSSPRGTLRTLYQAIEEAWRHSEEGNPEWASQLAVARRCLDTSRLPPRFEEEIGSEIAALFKEILDRIEWPPIDEIPGRAAVEETGLTSWTIPHTEIDVVQMQEGDRAGEFLISAESVSRAFEFFARVHDLPYKEGREGAHYDEIRFGGASPQVRALVRRLPKALKKDLFGLTTWQWISLATLLFAVSAASMVAFVLGRKWKRPYEESRGWNRLAPFLFPVTLLLMTVLVPYLLDFHLGVFGPIAIYTKLVNLIIRAIAVAWLVAVTLVRLTERVIDMARIDLPLNRQMLRATTRVLTILFTAGLFLWTGHTLGVPITTLLAGLGVGGIALALAAQSTVENLIGGINLYVDQPVRVGDLCRIGETIGVLEDVGLRSAKVRTLERSIVTIPNAQFAQLHLENLSRRDRILMRSTISLRYETTSQQLQAVLEGLRRLLAESPRIAEDKARVRFLGFGQYFLEVEVYAYALATAVPDFLEIRENFLMEAMRVVEESGTRLALPSEIHYVRGAEHDRDGRAGSLGAADRDPA